MEIMLGPLGLLFAAVTGSTMLALAFAGALGIAAFAGGFWKIGE